MQWSFSNKVSALPQFLSFKTTQEDRPRNTILDPLASSGYMTISTKDAFDSNQKPFMGVTQETRIFSVSNQCNQVSPVLQSNLATTGLNMVSSVIKPQPLSKSSGTPVSVHPSIGSIVGSTDLRATPIQNISVSTTKLQPEISFPSKNDGFTISQSYPSPSPMPSPLPPIASHASSQPRGRSSSNNELAIIRPVGSSTAPTNHLESPIVVGSVGCAAKKMVQPVCLPQARKASLARFLEKRKERVMSTSPYYMCKQSPECSSTPGSDSVSFYMDFSGSCPLPATN
ncbi:CO/COL/TOC1, conserved site [Sesbania bispinosa]|nr:CO/COL/TOC1, conserved site [Sesbania bispinosa]